MAGRYYGADLPPCCRERTDPSGFTRYPPSAYPPPQPRGIHSWHNCQHCRVPPCDYMPRSSQMAVVRENSDRVYRAPPGRNRPEMDRVMQEFLENDYRDDVVDPYEQYEKERAKMYRWRNVKTELYSPDQPPPQPYPLPPIQRQQEPLLYYETAPWEYREPYPRRYEYALPPSRPYAAYSGVQPSYPANQNGYHCSQNGCHRYYP